MRAFPVLHHASFVYSRVKALTWVSNGLVFPSQLQGNAGKAIATIAETVEPNKPLVLNCHGMNTVDDHALDAVVSALSNGSRQLVFLNPEPEFENRVHDYLGKPKEAYRLSESENVAVFGNAGMSADDARKILDEFPALEKLHLDRYVRGCFRKHHDGMKRLSSTPLLASGVFDARSLISNPESFVWICVTMADRLEELLQQHQPSRARLLAVSLRASPFAAAIGFLIKGPRLETEIVDHMGPKYAILEEYSLDQSRLETNYIYVGDFLIGGTELKIAQSYAHSKGASLHLAVVIGSQLSQEDYSPHLQIRSLVQLRSCCPEARYKFSEDSR